MKALFVSISCLLVFSLAAQNELSDRIYYSGGFGFSANSNQINVSVAPQLGYKITPRYSAGIGVIYQYVGVKEPKLTINNYGWSVFNRLNVIQQFFAYTEYERLSFEYFTGQSLDQKNRSWYSSMLIGAGYSEQLSGKASFSLMALYNVLYDPAVSPQPYNSPWVIRAGVGLGIF